MSVAPRGPLLVAVAIALAVALGMPALAQAQRQDRGERAEARGPQDRAGHQERRQDSMADSIRYVRRSSRGQILSAERMHSNGREINRIKVVDDRGRVRVFEDDPQRRRSQRQRSRGDDD